MIKFIRNYPLTSIALTILIFVEFIYLKDIFTDKNRIFSFSFDLSINGLDILWKSFNVPIIIFLASITPIWFIITLDEKYKLTLYEKIKKRLLNKYYIPYKELKPIENILSNESHIKFDGAQK